MNRRRQVFALFALLLLLATGMFVSGSAAAREPERSSALVPRILDDPSPEPSATQTETAIPTNTQTAVPTDTATPTSTFTATPTNTYTAVPTSTNTAVPTSTNTAVPTSTATSAPTLTKAPTATSVPTSTPTPTPSNVPPSLDLNGPGQGNDFATYYLVGSEASSIVGTSVRISDPDSARMSAATIRITNLKDGPAEKLNVRLFDTRIRIKNSSDGVLQLAGEDTVANYERVLGTASYQNTASRPSLDARTISFVVSDGTDSSVPRLSTVQMVDPGISLDISPAEQTVAKGSSAVFRIDVRNTGNVPLGRVKINSDDAPNCNLQFSSIPAGKQRRISCGVSTVETEFTAEVTVTAEDDSGNKVSAMGRARVDVLNPNIQIVKSPSWQTVAREGTAEFEVFVINTSNVVSLSEVEVFDPQSPNCNRTIGGLPKQGEVWYSCQQSNVLSAFVNEISVTGRDLLSNETVQDTSIATVDVIGVYATLVPEPAILFSPGGSVRFDVTIANAGNIAIRPQSLIVAGIGSLTDPSNARLRENSCLDALLARIDEKESYRCSFIATADPGFGANEFELSVAVRDEDANLAADTTRATVRVVDTSRMSVTLNAFPRSIAAPGGTITEMVSIAAPALVTTNGGTSDANLLLETLEHSVLGDLNQIGSCLLPQQVAPGQVFACEYQIGVSGEIGSSTVHSVIATGTGSGGVASGNAAVEEIVYFDPLRQFRWLPIVAGITAPLDDGNDDACSAIQLMSGTSQAFALDDENDWYRFSIERSGPVQVEVSNLTSPEAQVLIYAGETCQALSGSNLVAYNGDFQPQKLLAFLAEPGDYFLWITNPNGQPQRSPYVIFLDTP